MAKKYLSIILKLPAILILLASFFGSIYAVMKGIGGITLAVPITLFIVLVLYFIGESLKNKHSAGNDWGFKV